MNSARFFIVIFISSIFIPLMHSSENSTKILFMWAFMRQKTNGIVDLVDFNKEARFEKGDTFKIIIKPENSCYIYLFNLGISNDLSLVFPDDSEIKPISGKTYIIPEDTNSWISFENTHGTDKFFLLASSTKLVKLDKFIKEYLKYCDEPKVEIEKINTTRKNVLDEIQNLRNSFSKNTNYAEKPTSIAGTSRKIPGDDNGSKNSVISVEADKFYAKTLRIQH